MSRETRVSGDRLDPVLARLRLRRLLRECREAAGLTQAQVAEAIGASKAKITRVEAGENKITLRDLRQLLTLFGAADRLPEAELLARAAKARHWTTGFYRSVLTPAEMTCYRLEPVAQAIRYVDTRIVPILLQTEEYTRTLLSTLSVDPARGRLQALAWLRRQQLLIGPPPLRFFIDEAVLYRGADTAVGRDQLQYLTKMVEHPNVDIRVLPIRAAFATIETFILLGLPASETLLFIGAGTGLVREERPAEVRRRLDTQRRCEEIAVPAAPVIEQVLAGGRP